MAFDFRHEAREALARAQAELEVGNDSRLRYAALELRMALEALTYEKAANFRDSLSLAEYETWQPRRLMQMLLAIEPNADHDHSISFGLQEAPGMPTTEMKFLGTEVVLSIRDLKKHYDALGSFLHMPTVRQLHDGYRLDGETIRSRCNDVVGIVAKVLASRIWNADFHVVSEIICDRCGGKILKRAPPEGTQRQVKCFECNAPYLLESVRQQTEWRPMKKDHPCPGQGCKGVISFWDDELKPGKSVACQSCGGDFEIGLAIFSKGAAE